METRASRGIGSGILLLCRSSTLGSYPLSNSNILVVRHVLGPAGRRAWSWFVARSASRLPYVVLVRFSRVRQMVEGTKHRSAANLRKHWQRSGPCHGSCALSRAPAARAPPTVPRCSRARQRLRTATCTAPCARSLISVRARRTQKSAGPVCVEAAQRLPSCEASRKVRFGMNVTRWRGWSDSRDRRPCTLPFG